MLLHDCVMADTLKWRSYIMHQQEEAILGLLEGKSRFLTVNPIDESKATCGIAKVPPYNIHEMIKQTTFGLSLNNVSIFTSMGFDMHVGRMIPSSVSFMEDVYQENIFIPKRTKVVVPASSYKRTGSTMKFVGSIHPDYSKGVKYMMNRHSKMVKTNMMSINVSTVCKCSFSPRQHHNQRHAFPLRNPVTLRNALLPSRHVSHIFL